jgi:hypothetical protein
MPAEEHLRDLARQAITAEKIPSHKPDRVWGGPGIGASCTICDQPVLQNEMEFEVQWARDGVQPHFDVFHIHIRCFAAWEFERRKAES